ncbi:hypothetical protein FB461_2419 [Rarobacter faecitabidus]|uniref:Uncharacterized protein n=1 Tax=Rarobacter faecitabidus TaxID=13243 RepID=A0A542Z876_RARFA|nr:hypothetical protein FB461_2419 [Rarobacter faecitabidus]
MTLRISEHAARLSERSMQAAQSAGDAVVASKRAARSIWGTAMTGQPSGALSILGAIGLRLVDRRITKDGSG